MALTDQKWPDSFDFRTDDVCQTVFKPFIEEEMKAMKAYDAKRPRDITYIFHEHAPRVARDVRDTCLHLGLSDKVAENMYWAVLPHDIGKRHLTVGLWDMEEKPTDSIKDLRRSHTEIGCKIIKERFADIDHPFKDLMLDIMLYHHEQMDGNGYLGKAGEDLSAPVRLAAIVESYDGYSIWRPHFGDRDISPKGVLTRMMEEKGSDIYDMDLLQAFRDMKLNQSKDQ